MILKNEIITIFIILILAVITIVNFFMKKTDYIYKNNMFVSTLLKNKKRLINNKKVYTDFFNIAIFKSRFEEHNYMLIIQPQNYHFFIENNKLIYHPNNRHLDGLLKQYSCDSGFELAYSLPINNNNRNDNEDEDDDIYNDNDEDDEIYNDSDKGKNDENNNVFPKVICHKRLKYLKLNIYKPQNIIHYKKFETLQNPMNAIKMILNDIIEFL